MRVTGVKRNQKITAVADLHTIKPRIHNVFVVDASGSMSGAKYNTAIAGLNKLLKDIQEDTDSDNTVMIVEFESHRVVNRIELTSTVPSTYSGMGCGGLTPLNQAVGETLEHVVKERKKQYDVNDKILVNVFTDGGENSSGGKWHSAEGAKLLSEYIISLEAEGVTVTFMGTKEEVHYAVATLNMKASNTLIHDNTAADILRSFDRTVSARKMYSKSVAKGESVVESFYTKTVDTDETK